MAISNDERREVAARLRSVAMCYEKVPDVNKSFMWWEISKAVFGVDMQFEDSELIDAIADLIEPEPINGETSDGYHTFNELYHHRALLFSVVVRNYPELCWKSKKHHTGDMYEGMFIVGIDTPDGQASYHYDIEPYWDMFDCEELEFAPEWDGHTPAQAIERIGKLTRREPEERTCRVERMEIDEFGRYFYLSCGHMQMTHDTSALPYCPECGAKAVE